MTPEKFKFSSTEKINMTLFYLLLVVTILVWTGKISFGCGLGDLAYAMTVTLVFLLHGGLIFYGLKKLSGRQQSRLFGFLALIIATFTVFIIYKFTFGRGIEYKWNGRVFY